MTHWKNGFCQVNGINIHYLRTGGNKQPVVLLHGLMTNGACWSPFARTLEEDYDVIMPDARGHGNSSAPDQGYTYDSLVTDTLAFIETLKLPDPVLIGHSMGGMVAAVAACRNPQRIRALVLADPAFLTLQRQQEVQESDVVAQHLRITSRSREEFLAEHRMRHTNRSSELIELLVEARFQTSLHAFEILTPPNPDHRQLIDSLKVPSLLVIGGVGGVVSPMQAAELANLNRHLKVRQIADVGHGIPYDQPERFSALVKDFLQSLNI